VHRPTEGGAAVVQIEVGLQLGGVPRRLLRLLAGDQDRELVVSDAGDIATRGELRSEPVGDLAQQVVSFVVAVDGVDSLEPVDVAYEQRKRLRLVDSTGDCGLERSRVRQPSQQVALGSICSSFVSSSNRLPSKWATSTAARGGTTLALVERSNEGLIGGLVVGFVSGVVWARWGLLALAIDAAGFVAIWLAVTAFDRAAERTEYTRYRLWRRVSLQDWRQRRRLRRYYRDHPDQLAEARAHGIDPLA
jgi:hypothetical protein